MKKIAGLMVLLAVLLLGGYYAMGLATEHTLKSNITLINKSDEIHVDLKDYKRGWFKSKAQLNWVLHVPEQVITLPNNETKTMPARDLQIDMPLIISHGPIIYANSELKFGLGYAHTNLPLPDEFSKQFDENFAPESSKPKPELSLFINYLNHSKANFILPAFKIIDKKSQGQFFEWKGMNAEISIAKEKLDGNIKLTGMNYSDGTNVNASTGEIATDYNLKKNAKYGLYVGDVSTKIPSVSVKEASQVLFQLTGFSFYNKVDLNDNLLSTVLNISADEIVAKGKTVGPGHLDLSIKNLDADAAGKLNGYAIQMKNVPETEKQRISMAMLSQIPTLFGQGAEFEISRLDLRMPEGIVAGKAFVSLPKEPGMNPFVLVQKIKGTAELKIPVPVMKSLLIHLKEAESNQTPQQAAQVQQPAEGPAQTPETSQPSAEVATDAIIKGMIQAGVIVQHDNDFVIKLSIDKGQIMVNSKPFNPAMLKF